VRGAAARLERVREEHDVHGAARDAAGEGVHEQRRHARVRVLAVLIRVGRRREARDRSRDGGRAGHAGSAGGASQDEAAALVGGRAALMRGRQVGAQRRLRAEQNALGQPQGRVHASGKRERRAAQRRAPPCDARGASALSPSARRAGRGRGAARGFQRAAAPTRE
jgi:hypothetical protein